MSLWRSLRNLLITVTIGGVAVGACLAALVPGATALWNSNAFTTPAISNLRKLDQRSTVFDAAGNQIGVLGQVDRQAVPLSAVPVDLINGVVATEDRTFWTNDGIDIASVVRAAVSNFAAGKIEQGGSTITQQLVKNRILSNKRDLKRKVREILLALRLNKVYSKDEILDQYLNTVYFGEGSYGVQAAAERFFRTQAGPYVVNGDLSKLTLGQSALLAGLINDPSGDDPFINPDAALARRQFVLDQMEKQKYITPAQAASANAEPLPNPALRPTDDLRPRDAWTQQVEDSLVNDPRYAAALGPTPQARSDAVLKGGLKIYTTLDQNAQQNAQNAIDSVIGGVHDTGFTASLVAMDPNTGAVKAMIPGTNFDTSQYNIATHPYGLQLGSTWKVMTLAAALMNGFSPNDSVSGSSPCSFGSLGQTANAEAGEGTLTIASATAQSVNCAFARIELAVGIPNVISMATKMGINPNRPDTPGIHLDPVLTLTLGTILATPLEMATVMSTVASGGVHHAPYFVQRIVGPDGNTIYDQSSQGDRVLPEDVADCEISLLHGVITSGTGNPNAVLANNRPAFGKTGTTEDEANAAFYGGTYGQLVAFVWYGNKDANVPGAGFGGQKPAAMWKAFMDAQLASAPAVPLPDPGPVCSRPGSAISDSGQVTSSPASSSSGTSTSSGSAPSTTPAPTPSTVATPAPTQAPAPAPAPNPPPTQPPAPPTSPPPSGPPASRP